MPTTTTGGVPVHVHGHETATIAGSATITATITITIAITGFDGRLLALRIRRARYFGAPRIKIAIFR